MTSISLIHKMIFELCFLNQKHDNLLLTSHVTNAWIFRKTDKKGIHLDTCDFSVIQIN
jgi:hypothetical protein